MSAKEKQVVEVQEKLDDITECPICTETYKEPKILPCIHTFCVTCLQQTGLKTNKSPGDKMPCPICRKKFTIPGLGFVGLQRNFFMERLIEMKNILKPSSSRALCDACQEDNDLGAEAEIPSAEMYCIECSQRLCGSCCKIHRKYRVSKDHRIVSLDVAQIDIPSIIIKPYVCDQHENKPLEIYCSSCQEVVCSLCFFESHKTHEAASPVVNVVTDFRRIIEENADNTRGFIRELELKMKEQHNHEAVFFKQVADAVSEIKKSRQSLQERIEKDSDSLLEQLESIKDGRMKENESQLNDMEGLLVSLESYQSFCAQVTKIGSDVDICRTVHTLNTRATDLKKLYESVSLEPFPTIILKKAELEGSLRQTGNNFIGNIEGSKEWTGHSGSLIRSSQGLRYKNDDNETSQDKCIKPVELSFLLNELDDILDNASAEGNGDIRHQSNEFENVLDPSHLCAKEGDEVEVNAISVSNEMNEEKLGDKLKHLKVKVNNIVEARDKLRNELQLHVERVSKLEEEIISKNRVADLLKLTATRSDEEIVDLKRQVALLSQIAYNGDGNTKVKKTSKHKEEFAFLQTITTVNGSDAKSHRVTGLAILDNELFIASNSNVIEVNDLRTLKFRQRWHADHGVHKVVDMKASVRNKCIYILCDYSYSIELPGKRYHYTNGARLIIFTAKGKVVRQWKPDVDRQLDAQISVTDESNVILSSRPNVGYGDKLTEYSSDGEVLRAISFKWESGIAHLIHAVKLTSQHFLLCHGKDQDALHRVCIVDLDGNILKYYGEAGKHNQLNNPTYLELAGDGKILVADHLNQRLLLFDSSLKLTRKLYPYNPSDGDVIEKRPRKMILDETNGRMILVESIFKAAPLFSISGEKQEQHGDRLSAHTFSM